MTQQVNEFSIDIPMSTPVPPLSPPVEYVQNNGYAGSAAAVMSPAGVGDDYAIAVGDVAETDSGMDASKITVYAGNISPVSYNDSDPIACFDVVFTVGMNCDGQSKTYQVVKRIGIDKVKIAAQASAGAPVSVVEAIKPVDPEGQYIIKQTKELGGKEVVSYFAEKAKSGNYFWYVKPSGAQVFDSMSDVAKMMSEIDRNDPMMKDINTGKKTSKMEAVLLSKQDIKESQLQSKPISDVQKFRRLAGLD